MTFIQSYISKDVKERLKYCIICKNKVSDVKYNALCGLDMALATFSINCPYFAFNQNEFDHLRNETINEYKNKVDDDLCLDSEIYYNEAADFKNAPENLNQDFCSTSVYKSNPFNVHTFLGFSSIVVFVLTLIFSNSNSTMFYVWTTFAFLSILGIILYTYMRNVRKVVITEDFIDLYNFKSTKYYWSEILTIHSRTERTMVRGQYVYKIGIVIDLIVGDSIEYEQLYFLNPKKNILFLLCIDYHRRKFFNSELYN